jgi:hypothetical protein
MAYLLDANIFIEAKNHHYGFDLCPGFWDWLKLSNTIGPVRSGFAGGLRAFTRMFPSQDR